MPVVVMLKCAIRQLQRLGRMQSGILSGIRLLLHQELLVGYAQQPVLWVERLFSKHGAVWLHNVFSKRK
jgi:hypothetical protein